MDLTLPIEDTSTSNLLFGATDANLRAVRSEFDVRIAARDGSIHLSGDPKNVRMASNALNLLQRRLRGNHSLTERDVDQAIADARMTDSMPAAERRMNVLGASSKVVPKTPGQAAYIDAILTHDATFCLGPAGSGKTYLAVAVALSLLKQKQIDRLVLARPAVEAGEKIGFLPGDIQAKVNPFLRPLLDALQDMMGFDQFKRYMENDVIEVIPLAFMRGRTLNKAVVILDEAQNTTISQMLMVLTRLGMGSKMIVTADQSQTDLPPGQPSGVLDAVRRLQHVDGIAVIQLEKADIVRHPLVQSIVDAYADRGDDKR